MADKRFIILLILLGIMVLGSVIDGLIRTPKAKLRYDRLRPFFLGILFGLLAYYVLNEGKWENILFISIMGVSALWGVLNPSRFMQEDLSNDPGHWKWGMFYYNKQDKRIFPPRGSINFANPFSVGFLVLMLIGVVLFCSTWI